MEIRLELPDDHGLVALLYRQAFVGNYESELVDALRDAGVAPVSLVAIDEGELVGHILFADVGVTVDGRDVRALALAEMAVHPDQQRLGIGRRLIGDGLEAARALQFEAILVLGHPSYYPQFGFSAEQAGHLRVPFRGGDAFMSLELKPHSLDGVIGQVTYPDAFRLSMPR